MNLLQQTKYLIKKINLRPDKLKGQNFCVSREVLKQMVAAAEILSTDNVLEVGAGFGFLTTELLAKAKKVIAVELEPALAQVLRHLEAVHKNLQVVQGNILGQANLYGSTARPVSYKIVANLPYGITSAFLKRFLTAEHRPTSMTLLLQKEVAERICASPGQLSLLALSVQLYAHPKIMDLVGPENFWPQPKVVSAILQISNIHSYPFAKEVPEKVFWQVVRSGFAGKRKQLHHNLQSSLHLTKEQVEKLFTQAKIDQRVRAQELSIENWLRLAEIFYNLHK